MADSKLVDAIVKALEDEDPEEFGELRQKWAREVIGKVVEKQAEESRYQLLRNLPPEDAYQVLFHQTNGPAMTFERTFRERFAREHNTIQQAMLRHLGRPMLEVLAATQYPDARNAGAVMFAKQALAATGDIGLPTI